MKAMASSVIFRITVLIPFVFGFFLLTPDKAYANPYFYIYGRTEVTSGTAERYELHLNTDGNQIGAMQAVVNFDSNYFTATSISIVNSQCSMWTPANSAPPGENLTKVTPYFYNSKVVLTCGFTGSGYNGSDGLIATVTLTPYKDGTTSLTFSDSYFAFLGSTIVPGAMDPFTLTITGTAQPTVSPTAIPSVTPTVAPTPTATPTPTASASATPVPSPTPIVNQTVLFDDVTVVDVTDNFTRTGSSGTTSTGSNSQLEVIEEDNTIPAPPPLSPRPNATPFVVAENNLSEPSSQGEVMAVQGLRDLLIPGKSKADKTVVLINFISTLTFLILLAVAIWKMIMNSRSSKLKARYIEELISGELAALETKMEILKEKSGSDKFQSEFEETVSEIMQGLNPERENSKET